MKGKRQTIIKGQLWRIGNATVSNQELFSNRKAKYLVMFKDYLGFSQERWFSTLKEVDKFFAR